MGRLQEGEDLVATAHARCHPLILSLNKHQLPPEAPPELEQVQGDPLCSKRLPTPIHKHTHTLDTMHFFLVEGKDLMALLAPL